MKNKTTGKVIVPVPTLSGQGFIYSTGDKLDRLLSYYLLSDKNQSEVFGDMVVSFQHTIATYQRVPLSLCEQVKRELENYLQRYFTVVTVEVTYNNLVEGVEDGPYEVVLDVMAGDSFDEQQHLYKNTHIEDGTLIQIFTYNNSGRLLKNERNVQTTRSH